MEKTLNKILWEDILNEFIGRPESPERTLFKEELENYFNEIDENEKLILKSVFIKNEIDDINTYCEMKKMLNNGFELSVFGVLIVDYQFFNKIEEYLKCLITQYENNHIYAKF